METEQNRVLRPKEAARLVGLSVRQLCNLEHNGKFVPKVKLGPKSVGYELMDLRAWIESRKSA